jgi:predicted GH43/DUF377 family glycosyl hydrolase
MITKKEKKYVLNIKIFFCLCWLFSDLDTPLSASLTTNDFIEEIIQINIPGLEGAYNPSIIDFEDGYLMVFRYDSFKKPISKYVEDYFQYIGIIKLDKDFKPASKWQSILGDRTYDPRLLKVNNEIFMIYCSARKDDKHSMVSSQLNLCKIKISGDNALVEHNVSLKVPFQKKWEKNWVPFESEGNLFMEYQISPHIVIQVDTQSGFCSNLDYRGGSLCKGRIKWPFGLIRGGTPALVVDNSYLGFFHSSLYDSITNTHTYYVGAYTFMQTYPFALEKISFEPFFSYDFYSTPKNEKTSSNVVFPGGYVIKEDKIFLCYGENDDAIKIMKIDKENLYKNMRVLQKKERF